MYMYIYTYIHTYIHIYIHTKCIYIQCTCACIHASIHSLVQNDLGKNLGRILARSHMILQEFGASCYILARSYQDFKGSCTCSPQEFGTKSYTMHKREDDANPSNKDKFRLLIAFQMHSMLHGHVMILSVILCSCTVLAYNGVHVHVLIYNVYW